MQRAAQRQEQAWAPGTIANYRSALRKYLGFCFEMELEPTNPSNYDICAYIEYLASDTPSPRTISNHLSHIRTYLRKAAAQTTQVDHFRVGCAMTAIKRNKQYVPRVKKAFPVEDLHRMLITLPDTTQGNIIRVSVLLMFYAALRQSEVLAPTMASFDHRKHLTRGDISFKNDQVFVLIKHAKNMQTVYETKTVTLNSAPNQRLCIVTSLKEMFQATPSRSQLDPCIMFPGSRRPVPVDYVRRNWKLHLERNGMDTAPLSLHSIRKSAATAAYDHGCPELDIQRYGGWRSHAYRQYITSSNTTVNRAIVQALDKNN